MKRFGLGIVISLFLSILAYFVLLPFEQYLLETVLEILPIAGVKQTMWIETFLTVGSICLFVSLIFTIIWQFFGQFAISISAGWLEVSRGIWLMLLGLLLLLIIILGIFLNFATQDWGRYLASVFYAINGIVIYYFSSLFSSPIDVKYAPIGSKLLK